MNILQWWRDRKVKKAAEKADAEYFGYELVEKKGWL